MCLSTVYERQKEKDQFLYRNIAKVQMDPNQLIFTDLLGETSIYKGHILEMDFMNNIILVEKESKAQ